MLIIPAMDLLDRHVVRIEQGDQERRKVYSDDPVGMVKGFSDRGARLVHVVDLNAAIRNDRETNSDLISQILSKVRCGVQIAGGIRSIDDAREKLEKGAQRVVISSVAYSKPDEAFAILQSLGAGCVVLALDYGKNFLVRTSGWSRQEKELVFDAVSRFSKLGFNYFLATSVERDGLLNGPDYSSLERLRKENPAGSARIIASGGVSTEEDLSKLARFGIDEAIVGKAIYEGKIANLSEVFR